MHNRSSSLQLRPTGSDTRARSLRFVFKHSIALACLVGVLVMPQAYVFTGMIVK